MIHLNKKSSTPAQKVNLKDSWHQFSTTLLNVELFVRPKCAKKRQWWQFFIVTVQDLVLWTKYNVLRPFVLWTNALVIISNSTGSSIGEKVQCTSSLRSMNERYGNYTNSLCNYTNTFCTAIFKNMKKPIFFTSISSSN